MNTSVRLFSRRHSPLLAKTRVTGVTPSPSVNCLNSGSSVDTSRLIVCGWMARAMGRAKIRQRVMTPDSTSMAAGPALMARPFMTSGGRTRRKMGRKQLRVVTVCHTAWNGEAQWYAP